MSVRQRNTGRAGPKGTSSSEKSGAFFTASTDKAKIDRAAVKQQKVLGIFKDDYQVASTIITILSFVTRFWWLNYPSEVV